MKKSKALIIVILISLGLWGCANQNELTPEEAKAIAEEAYIFAYPMLDNYKMMFAQAIYEQSPAYEAPFNQLKHKSILLGPEYTTIVRPNNDTFYSIVWMDLRNEPVILRVPAIRDNRYYSFQLIDLYTHNFDYIGTRATGFDAGTHMIAGPDWKGEKPQGVDKVIPCETNFAVALGRTQVFSPEDVPNAKTIQSQYHVQPLSQFMGTAASEAPAMPKFPPYNPEKVKTAEFIGYLNFLLGQVKPHPDEKELLAKFAKIGIEPNKPFDSQKVDPAILEAINEGVADALVKIEETSQKLGERKNGWQLISGAFGTRKEMQGKYLTRAAAAFFGLWGNTLEEAYYPEANVDADGEALDGSKHNYLLHFDTNEIPPAKAFWSVTLYDSKNGFFIPNNRKKYSVRENAGMKVNKNGGIEIYVAAEKPNGVPVENWLPINRKDENLDVILRIYVPDLEKVKTWKAPKAEKI